MSDPLDDTEAIAKTVRAFAESELAPHAVRWDETHHFPVDVLRRAGALGLGGICVAEDVGGSALDRSTAVRIFEELARGDTSIAAYVSIHNMVTAAIDTTGTPEQRRRWVPGLSELTQLSSYCLTEPDAGSDAAAIRTAARRVADDYVLAGTKQFISGAGVSDVYLVMARTSETGADGITAFLVPGDAPGLRFGANERKMGWRAQPTRQVILDDVRVPAAHRLGGEGDGFQIAMAALDGGRLNIAACSLGGAQWAYEQTKRYLLARHAFGRPLAHHQALLFALADMATSLEAARCLLQRAAAALDARSADATKLCAMAKRFVTDAAFEVANTALQLHGGYGYLSDYGIEKIVRDLRVHQILEGTNEIMRRIVGRRVLAEAA